MGWNTEMKCIGDETKMECIGDKSQQSNARKTAMKCIEYGKEL